DLLDVSRISTGRIELRREPTDLTDVLTSAVETSRPLIAAGNHRLTVQTTAEPVLLHADPVRLAQVFSNLLNNAAKYSEPGGSVTLTARREAEEVVVSVRDTGVGIPAEMLPRIFDLFTQVDRTLEKSQGGLGIGLALVRRLLGLHGGSITAHSEGMNRGSEFIVRLPTLETSPLADAAQQAGAVGRAGECVGHRVLVVDDNRDSCASLAKLLTLLGNEVWQAHDGFEALTTVATHCPEVVVMDIGMPGLNGYEVARRLRSDPVTKNTTLIALTGWGQDDDRRRSREAGFDHHLVKPVDLAAVKAILAGVAR
ncbi:MAG TPA: ATP-binding protein, partial [Pirellulales bacterium]